jgi:hypothetical protein
MSRALPARYPPHGAWPAMMRADLAAAYFDLRDTKELSAAVVRGDLPPPCGSIGKGRSKEPVWTMDYCRAFIARRFDGGVSERSEAEDLADMV